MKSEALFYQKEDGFFYFSSEGSSGSYDAAGLRALADRLDALNLPMVDAAALEMSSTAGDIGTGEG